jgi:putative ABC transport system permease protein
LLAIRVACIFLAVTLVAAVSLYSGAVGNAMLQTYLARDLYVTAHMGVSYETLGVPDQPLSGAAYAALDSYVHTQEQTDLGLPLANLYVHHFVPQIALYRASGPRSLPTGPLLAALPVEYYAGLAAQVVLVRGAFGLPAGASRTGVPTVVSATTARALRLRLGDRLIGATPRHRALTAPLVIAGIYVPKNPAADFWSINSAQPFAQSLVLTRPADFVQVAAGAPFFDPTYYWRYDLSLDAIHLDGATALLDHIQRVRSRISLLAPGTELHTLLDQDINGFLYSYALLPVALYVLVAPIVLLVLYAIAVVTALILERQAGEIVLMRSRGATRRQVFGLYLVEGLLVGALATAGGPLLGLPLARLIGQSAGFLRFGGGLPVVLSLEPATFEYAALTALLALSFSLLPALALTGRTMARYKHEQARASGAPPWQRLYLDVLLLIVALYGYAVLFRQGQITSGAGMAAIVQDPVIGLTPLAFAVALALVLSRSLPVLAAVCGHAVRGLPSPSAQIALQSVARAPRQPMRLVGLLSLTLSLGVFAATVAGVEERNVADQQLYATGATLRLVEERYGVEPRAFAPLTMPVSWHLALPGVQAASPALRYDSSGGAVNATDSGVTVNVLGIDPGTAARVIWFRPDFAAEPLATLLGHLATPGPNAIVSRTFLAKTGLHAGDSFDVTLSDNHTVHAVVAAVASYFPSLDPSDNGAPFVVMNLQHLVAAAHRHGPSEMWLKTADSQAAVDRVVAAAHARPSTLGQILDYSGVAPPFSPNDNPLQAGIYGVVSIGFLIAGLLSLLGFVTYAHLSLQRRLSDFAVVRALGLSRAGLRWLLLCEQLFLLGGGILGGIAAGVLTTVLFLPYMPIAQSTMPPYLVVVPWSAVEGFVLAVLAVFAIVLSLHIWTLLRANLGRVLRLGEG